MFRPSMNRAATPARPLFSRATDLHPHPAALTHRDCARSACASGNLAAVARPAQTASAGPLQPVRAPGGRAAPNKAGISRRAATGGARDHAAPATAFGHSRRQPAAPSMTPASPPGARHLASLFGGPSVSSEDSSSSSAGSGGRGGAGGTPRRTAPVLGSTSEDEVLQAPRWARPPTASSAPAAGIGSEHQRPGAAAGAAPSRERPRAGSGGVRSGGLAGPASWRSSSPDSDASSGSSLPPGECTPVWLRWARRNYGGGTDSSSSSEEQEASLRGHRPYTEAEASRQAPAVQQMLQHDRHSAGPSQALGQRHRLDGASGGKRCTRRSLRRRLDAAGALPAWNAAAHAGAGGTPSASQPALPITIAPLLVTPEAAARLNLPLVQGLDAAGAGPSCKAAASPGAHADWLIPAVAAALQPQPAFPTVSGAGASEEAWAPKQRQALLQRMGHVPAAAQAGGVSKRQLVPFWRRLFCVS